MFPRGIAEPGRSDRHAARDGRNRPVIDHYALAMMEQRNSHFNLTSQPNSQPRFRGFSVRGGDQGNIEDITSANRNASPGHICRASGLSAPRRPWAGKPWQPARTSHASVGFSSVLRGGVRQALGSWVCSCRPLDLSHRGPYRCQLVFAVHRRYRPVLFGTR